VQPIAGRHDAAGGVAPAPWNYATRLPGRPAAGERSGCGPLRVRLGPDRSDV